MKLSFHYRLVLMPMIFLTMLSCRETVPPYGAPVMKADVILENSSNFSKYWRYKLQLTDDFIALDTAFNEIPKGQFLQQVSTGEYLPLLLHSDTNSYYKLDKINRIVDDWITISLQSIGFEEYQKFLWEGKSVPEFSFTDLNGVKYSNQATKGKVLVLKFWFIGCVACVEEMPELNQLVNQYKNRDDVIFIAIAPDTEQQLHQFLKRTRFDYSVISDTSSSLEKTLKIQSFPTHIVVNKNGNVVKILNGYGNNVLKLKSALKKQLQ